jgi:XTP/dITP diphosphohydrolase
MKILVASKNPAKLKEMQKYLGEGFELVSLADFPDAPFIEETGKTFEENALLKAKSYFEWSGIPSVSDDGGLEIDALNGEPGVLSRRWPSVAEAMEGKPGREKTDEELIDIAMSKLKGVPREKRTAHLRTVGCFYDGAHTLMEADAIDGYIIEDNPGRHEEGYPFRAIFWIPKFNKLYQDLTEAEHEDINHRRKAYGRLRDKILTLKP